MVAFKDIETWNESLSNYPPGLISLFAGGTSGIGLAALKAFAKRMPAPKVYIVGRSEAKFQANLDELRALNPEGSFIFLEGDVSLIKEVDRLTEEIKKRESTLDLLIQSQGAVELGVRKFTSENISLVQSLRYYSRMRFIQQLLPLLSASSSPSPRIISILAGGQEGPIDINDPDMMHSSSYSIARAGEHAATMMTLAMEYLSLRHPSLSFAHTFPGLVRTDLLNRSVSELTGWRSVLGSVASYTVLPLIKRFVAMPVEEAGERVLFIATSPRYACLKASPGTADIAGALAPLQPSVPGRSVYRVAPDGETVIEDSVLGFYREQGYDDKVWQHTLEVFEKVTGKTE